jgi:hypothetical protein
MMSFLGIEDDMVPLDGFRADVEAGHEEGGRASSSDAQPSTMRLVFN